jgi:hypothetical protein
MEKTESDHPYYASDSLFTIAEEYRINDVTDSLVVDVSDLDPLINLNCPTHIQTDQERTNSAESTCGS